MTGREGRPSRPAPLPEGGPAVSPRSDGHAVRVPNADLAAHAERLLSAPRVERHELALGFDDSEATAGSVHVGGADFFPLQLEDIGRATSSIHFVQFGFKPGKIGELFADALAAKAKAGVPVRIVVDKNGSSPEGGSKDLYAKL